MSSRNEIFKPGSIFHIYNRGCNRNKIFFEENNYIYLLQKIKHFTSEFKISVIAYCLMPNHYHLLLRQNSEKPLNKCVQFIFNGYSKAINKKYNRSGTLFQGKFKSVEVDEGESLNVCRYIHRNPLDDRLVDKLENWKFSNYLEWIEKRNGELYDKDFVKKHFSKPELYEKFVLDYFSDKQAASELRKYIKLFKKKVHTDL